MHCLPPRPLVMGSFYGNHKPSDVEEYLHDFVNEMEHLSRDGLEYSGKVLNVALSSIVCDVPTHAFVKNTKLHSGYFSGDKCVTKGCASSQPMHHFVHTDESFTEMRDEDHHVRPNPSCWLSFRMVTQIPIDYMHDVILGVVQCLIKMWRSSPMKTSQISRQTYESVSNTLCFFQPVHL